MANIGNTAPRDANQVPALLGTSSSDGKTVTIYANPVTHRLLVDTGGSGSSLTVTDGVTTVTPVTTIDFTSGAVVTDGGGGIADIAIAGGTGTVTTVSVVSANGLAGTVANATTTPAITLSTTITGLLKGNGTAISAATAGTDYTNLAFKTYSVSGQSDIVAASAEDTFTFVAGTNITLTTNAGTKTLTIAAAGTSGLTVGTTTIASGTTTRVLFDNAGVLGEYTISGTGSVAMTNSPTFVTPTLGVASGTTFNKLTLTPPATGSTFTLADGKTFTVSNTLTFTGTDGSSVAFGAGGTVLYANQTITLSGIVTGSGTTAITTSFGTFSSATLAAALTDETGTGVAVFGTSPTIASPTFSGTIAGTYTIGGTPTFPSAVTQNTATQTLSNKRITRRITTVNAPGATPSTNSDNDDVASFTGLAANITSMTTNLSGTPNDCDFLEFKFIDNGTPRTISWGASYGASTVALPTTTVANTVLRVLFEWSAALTIWVCVAVA